VDRELLDPVIGRLVHDGYYYNGSGTYGETQFEFTIGTYEVSDVPARLEKARSIYRAVDRVVERAANYAATKMLELKNDSWEEEDGRVISHQEFKERLVISSLTLDHDGDLVIYFDDGDLFFGHHVMVTETSDGTLDRAEIQG
jgi:hypothetical protein